MLRIMRHTLMTTLFLFAAAFAQASSHQCPDVSKMKLTVDEYYLTLNDKKPICTSVPGTIKLKIKNSSSASHQVQKGDVTVTQKTGSPLTISGSNSGDRLELIISISGNPSNVDVAAFLITVKDVGVLDPKVRVVNKAMLLQLLTHAIDEALDILGLTWEDAARVVSMQLKSAD